MSKAVGEKAFDTWTSSGSGGGGNGKRQKPQQPKGGDDKTSKAQEAKRGFLKELQKMKGELSREIGAARSLNHKIQEDDTGLFAAKFQKGFEKSIQRMQKVEEMVIQQVASAEEMNCELFVDKTKFKDLQPQVASVLEEFKVEFKAVASKHFK